MALIKSALEIALEKTEGVVGDKEKIEADNAVKEGKRLASAFLNAEGDAESREIKDSLKPFAGKKLAWVKEGMLQVFLANIVLPADDNFGARLARIAAGLPELGGDRKKISYVFQQLDKFLLQYRDSRVKIREQLEQQFAPRLRQREAQLSQQVGSKVRLNPLQDPEFAGALQKNFAALDERYQEALANLKEDLKSMYT